MEVELRKEEEKDYFETENVIREAFWNRFIPACDDHYILHIMRLSPDFIPELDIVAIHNKKIVGNVVYVKCELISDDGNKYEVIGLGPIGVLPEFQRKGIGSKLINYSRQIASQMGFRAIFLFGDPNYYTKNGFVSAESMGIRTEDNKYHDAMHVCELYKDALKGIKGRYIENKIYKADEEKVKEFDSKFPKKEIVVGTPSQIKFSIISKTGKKVD